MPNLFVIAQVAEGSLPDVIAALKPFLTSSVQTFVQYEPTTPDSLVDDIDVDEDLAQAIAEKIKPSAKQPMRKEVLKNVLWHWDSFLSTGGEGDTSMRGAIGSLSKSLKSLAPLMTHPVELICTRERQFEANGQYRGTVYEPTRLGLRVREILIKHGQIN